MERTSRILRRHLPHGRKIRSAAIVVLTMSSVRTVTSW
jgi:hypothetical protein